MIEGGGPWAIAALMFLENLFPPIPSELIMPLAGFNAARGVSSLWSSIAAGTAGSLAGAWFWYFLGQRVGPARLRLFVRRRGRWLALSPRDLRRAQGWFDRHGRRAVFLGRFIPTVRTLISVPAGLSRMPAVPFLLYSAMGSLIWTSALTLAGYVLEGGYERVGHLMNPLSTAVVAALIGFYLWRVATYDPSR